MAVASPTRKKAINVTIDPVIAAEAKAAGLNLSGLLDRAVRSELKVLREAEWRKENRAAIEESNRHFEEHGLPLEKYRA